MPNTWKYTSTSPYYYIFARLINFKGKNICKYLDNTFFVSVENKLCHNVFQSFKPKCTTQHQSGMNTWRV